MKPRITSLIVLLLLISINLMGQYKFDSKELKKLYQKLETAYDEYDYETILDHETRILELVEPKQDTLTALVYFFLGESYNIHMNDPYKGLEFFQKEMTLREKIQNEDEIDNTSYFNMAKIMDELGQYDEAEALYFKVIESDKKTYGLRSEEYIYSALSLGIHYQYVRDYESFKKGLKLYRSLFRYIKKDHPRNWRCKK